MLEDLLFDLSGAGKILWWSLFHWLLIPFTRLQRLQESLQNKFINSDMIDYKKISTPLSNRIVASANLSAFPPLVVQCRKLPVCINL